MSAFRRIVVGYDGTEGARDALALARRLADPEGGELILGYADVHRTLPFPHHQKRTLEPEEALSCVTRTAPSPARALTELTEELEADLLVLGSVHTTAPGRIFPGRTARRLLQGAPCAVAIAPAGSRSDEPFFQIAVAYDGSAEAAAAMRAAYALAARDHAAVSLYSVLASGGPVYGAVAAPEVDEGTQRLRLDVQAKLDAAADSAPRGVNPRTVLLYGDPATEIARACDGVADVLFAGSRGYGPMQRVLAGSVSEALLLAATQPVVVLPRTGIKAPEAA